MLRNMMHLGAAAERLVAVVYATLATRFPAASLERGQLEALAADEHRHAEAMVQLEAAVPVEYPGYDYARVLAGQATFIATCADQLHELQSGTPDPQVLLRELAAMEGSLSENLFLHVQMLAEPAHRETIRQLAVESVRHRRVLEAMLHEEAEPLPGPEAVGS